MTHTATEHLAATQSAHSKSRKDATASRQLRDLNSHTQPIQESPEPRTGIPQSRDATNAAGVSAKTTADYRWA